MAEPDPPSDRRGPPKDALDDQIQHVERQAAFAREIAGALREEFGLLWRIGNKRDLINGAEDFVAQVESTASLAQRYIDDAGKARGLPPQAAARLVRLLDVNKLRERGRGLEAAARTLRQNPKLQSFKGAPAPSSQGQRPTGQVPPRGTAALNTPGRPGTAPLPPAAPKRTLTERLQDALDRLVITTLEVEPPPPPPTVDQRRLQAFEGALALVADVLADTGPRLEALQFALAAAQVGGMEDPVGAAKAAGVPSDLRALIPAASEALKGGPLVRRAAAIALQQWEHAARLADGYTRARTIARNAPREQVAGLLAPYDVTKLKGMIAPLTNLHLTFKMVPALAALFPPPVRRRMELAVPPPDAPKPPPEAADEAAPAGEAVEEAAAAPRPLTKFSPEETSARRMALIMQWLEDPAANPAISDPTVIYRIVAEEREYQADRVSDLGMRLRLLPAGGEGESQTQAQQRHAIREALDQARLRQVQLQEVMSFVMKPTGDGG